MKELERPVFSLELIKSAALVIFRENDSYDDEEGLHPNTIRRSSKMAVEKILKDYELQPLDLYSFIASRESLPDINELKKQGFSNKDTDRIVKKMFSSLVQKDILLNNPELVEEQTYRIRRFGVIK